MSTPDKNGWIKGLESAPQDDEIVVVVPVPDEDGRIEYVRAIAWWVDKMSGGYWDGDWRYLDVLGAEDCEPTHWKPLDLPVEYEDAEEAA